jgi:hypothetical protein
MANLATKIFGKLPELAQRRTRVTGSARVFAATKPDVIMDPLAPGIGDRTRERVTLLRRHPAGTPALPC